MISSMLFDTVAVILPDKGAKALSKESATIDFARDAFGHLEAIAVDEGSQKLLQVANVGPDAGLADAEDQDATMDRGKVGSNIGMTAELFYRGRVTMNRLNNPALQPTINGKTT